MTTPVHQRRLKVLSLAIGASEFQCQLKSWTLDPGTQQGDRQYTYCDDPLQDNSFVEETDDQPTLALTFFSDWRSLGISDYLWSNPNVTATFVLDHHPNIALEHVRWTGKVLLKPPAVGGDVRTTEITEITLQVLGTVGDGLDFERISGS